MLYADYGPWKVELDWSNSVIGSGRLRGGKVWLLITCAQVAHAQCPHLLGMPSIRMELPSTSWVALYLVVFLGELREKE